MSGEGICQQLRKRPEFGPFPRRATESDRTCRIDVESRGKRKSWLTKEDLSRVIRLSDSFKNIYGRSNSNRSTKQFPLSQICTFPGLRSQAEEFISLVINGDACGRDGAKPTLFPSSAVKNESRI